ncbi:Glutaredoxin-1 protein [Aphelenchoides fujianensis]|nr:Glutaredoxin-1 protein [Aphelenchoides fujianensis]
MSAVKSLVDSLIANHKVAVFSKSYCPFCHKAKDALAGFKYQPNAFKWLEIDDREDCQQIQDYLAELTGGRTVPRVFIGGQFFGGGDATKEAKDSGKLEKKLAEVGAI